MHRKANEYLCFERVLVICFFWWVHTKEGLVLGRIMILHCGIASGILWVGTLNAGSKSIIVIFIRFWIVENLRWSYRLKFTWKSYMIRTMGCRQGLRADVEFQPLHVWKKFMDVLAVFFVLFWIRDYQNSWTPVWPRLRLAQCSNSLLLQTQNHRYIAYDEWHSDSVLHVEFNHLFYGTLYCLKN